MGNGWVVRIEVCRLTTDAIQYDAGQHTLVLRVDGKGSKERELPLNGNSAAWLALHLLAVHGSPAVVVLEGWGG